MKSRHGFASIIWNWISRYFPYALWIWEWAKTPYFSNINCQSVPSDILGVVLRLQPFVHLLFRYSGIEQGRLCDPCSHIIAVLEFNAQLAITISQSCDRNLWYSFSALHKWKQWESQQELRTHTSLLNDPCDLVYLWLFMITGIAGIAWPYDVMLNDYIIVRHKWPDPHMQSSS